MSILQFKLFYLVGGSDYEEKGKETRGTCACPSP